MGRIERGLGGMGCVLWMFATVLYSIKRGQVEKRPRAFLLYKNLTSALR